MLNVAGIFYNFNPNLRNTNKRKRIYQTTNIKKNALMSYWPYP